MQLSVHVVNDRAFRAAGELPCRWDITFRKYSNVEHRQFPGISVAMFDRISHSHQLANPFLFGLQQLRYRVIWPKRREGPLEEITVTLGFKIGKRACFLQRAAVDGARELGWIV